jgi:ABC-2 type transport system permease protein
MPSAPSSKPSFSTGRKWSIGFGVVVTTVTVFAVVVMLNYLSGQIFRRAYLSSHTRIELSSRTTSLLHALTNRVQVTVYCSKDEPFFADLADLLKEYTSANPNLNVRYIDYDRDPGAAEEFKIKYNLAGSTNKNLIIFDCEGRIKTVNGDALVQNQLVQERSENQGELALRKKPVAFLGELLFTGALIGVTNPKPFKAYFLEGHGEHRLDNASDPTGYAKFADVLRLNCVNVEKLTLLGTNTVPDDCSLLVIAGPKDPLPAVELSRIEKYLNEGGRLLALFNFIPVQQQTTIGLEKVLAKWGVNVTTGFVKDPDYSSPPEGLDVIAFTFRVRHPLVNSLLGQRLQLILPREIDALDLSSQPDNGLKAEEIVFSGPRSILSNGGMAQRPGAKPLIVAVEKNAAKGVAAERGATRLLITGDSLFLGNERIESAANRDFAGYAANWLLDRPVLLEGVAPKSISEYRLLISNLQLQTVKWILLAGMPGGVLMLGGLVWLRRRK